MPGYGSNGPTTRPTITNRYETDGVNGLEFMTCYGDIGRVENRSSGVLVGWETVAPASYIASRLARIADIKSLVVVTEDSKYSNLKFPNIMTERRLQRQIDKIEFLRLEQANATVTYGRSGYDDAEGSLREVLVLTGTLQETSELVSTMGGYAVIDYVPDLLSELTDAD